MICWCCDCADVMDNQVEDRWMSIRFYLVNFTRIHHVLGKVLFCWLRSVPWYIHTYIVYKFVVDEKPLRFSHIIHLSIVWMATAQQKLCRGTCLKWKAEEDSRRTGSIKKKSLNSSTSYYYWFKCQQIIMGAKNGSAMPPGHRAELNFYT